MGYNTYFTGEFKLDKPFKPEHARYLERFASTRRVKRHALQAARRPNSVREAAGLPVGSEGAYFVGEDDESVLDANHPPKGQPGLWCDWAPNEDGTAIVWNEAEKFYDYVEWITYIVEHFLKPWGYSITGVVEWSGEEQGDVGKIIAVKNEITVKRAKITYE